MKKEIQQLQDDFIETVGELCASFSISRIVGQLYALLYINREPVSLDDMVERLNVSKGNVSVNIRILENWGAVRKAWIKGSRKNFKGLGEVIGVDIPFEENKKPEIIIYSDKVQPEEAAELIINELKRRKWLI